MTKRELFSEYQKLCELKRVVIDGIYGNSNKGDIQNAIDCLRCEDEMLDDYMTVVKLKYPYIYQAISENGDFKTHSNRRLFVYNTARNLLKTTN